MQRVRELLVRPEQRRTDAVFVCMVPNMILEFRMGYVVFNLSYFYNNSLHFSFYLIILATNISYILIYYLTVSYSIYSLNVISPNDFYYGTSLSKSYS